MALQGVYVDTDSVYRAPSFRCILARKASWNNEIADKGVRMLSKDVLVERGQMGRLG